MTLPPRVGRLYNAVEQAKAKVALRAQHSQWLAEVEKAQHRAPDVYVGGKTPVVLYGSVWTTPYTVSITAFTPDAKQTFLITEPVGKCFIGVNGTVMQPFCVHSRIEGAQRSGVIATANDFLERILESGGLQGSFTHIAKNIQGKGLTSYTPGMILTPGQHAAFARYSQLPPPDNAELVVLRNYGPEYPNAEWTE